MLRTNSRKAMENIRKEIVNSYEAANEYYTFEGREAKTDFNEICADILEAFRIEKLENDCYYIAGRASKNEMFMDWMQDKAEKLACNLLYRELEKGARK